LLKAAKYPSKEEQIRAMREEAARKDAPCDDADASRRRVEAAINAVSHLSPEELGKFVDWFDDFLAESNRGGNI